MIEKMLTALTVATTKFPAAPYCLPVEAVNAMDTAKFWTTLIAAGFAVIGLLLIGIGMFFQHRRGDGGEMLKSLGWWIGGVILVAAATGIVSIFLNAPTDCVTPA